MNIVVPVSVRLRGFEDVSPEWVYRTFVPGFRAETTESPDEEPQDGPKTDPVPAEPPEKED